MPRRYDMRIPTAIKVKVRGTDAQGNSFEQVASTINVSRTGARLQGVSLVSGVETVELRRGWFRKARFRVVWAGAPGTAEADQIGLRQMEKDGAFWGIPFPAPQVQPDPAPVARAAAASVSGPPASAAVLPGKWDTPAPLLSEPSSYDSNREPLHGSPPRPESELVDLTWQAPPTSTSRTIRERVASVKIRWSTPAGEAREEAFPAARVLRDKSCIVPMRVALPEGTEVTIVNARTGGSRPGTVSMCGPQMPDGTYPIAMDLESPDTAFWGSGSAR